MATEPDVMLNLPPAATATMPAMRDAMIETAKAMITAGYHPAMIGRAMMGAGATLALDLAGREWALAELRGVADAVSNAVDRGQLDGPVAGNA